MEKPESKKKFVITLSLLVLLILFPFIFSKDSLYVIISPSMTPTLNVGDLVIRGEKSPEDIQVGEVNGDILILKGPQYYYEHGFDPRLFNNLANNTPIIHRAIDKKKVDNVWYFLTKGDNNKLPDGGLIILNDSDDYYLLEYNRTNSIYISETEILGVVIFKIPFIGYINIYFPFILILLISLTILYIVLKLLGINIRFERASRKKLKNDYIN